MVAVLESKASRHSQLRWLGVVFFCLAALQFLGMVGAVVAGHATIGKAVLSIFGLGMSMGTFGTNDDSALYAMRELHRNGILPERFRAEWQIEVERRPQRIPALHDAPKASIILPIVAILANGGISYMLLTAWGVL